MFLLLLVFQDAPKGVSAGYQPALINWNLCNTPATVVIGSADVAPNLVRVLDWHDERFAECVTALQGGVEVESHGHVVCPPALGILIPRRDPVMPDQQSPRLRR